MEGLLSKACFWVGFFEVLQPSSRQDFWRVPHFFREYEADFAEEEETTGRVAIKVPVFQRPRSPRTLVSSWVCDKQANGDEAAARLKLKGPDTARGWQPQDLRDG